MNNTDTQFYNVLSRKELIIKGKSKVTWRKVGQIKMTQKGGRYLHLFHLPNIEYYIAEQSEDGTSSENPSPLEE